eukprot:1162080-Pelagomonas_calceolata.AAC.11
MPQIHSPMDFTISWSVSCRSLLLPDCMRQQRWAPAAAGAVLRRADMAVVTTAAELIKSLVAFACASTHTASNKNLRELESGAVGQHAVSGAASITEGVGECPSRSMLGRGDMAQSGQHAFRTTNEFAYATRHKANSGHRSSVRRGHNRIKSAGMLACEAHTSHDQSSTPESPADLGNSD